ncbi:transposase, partial [Butyricicoccus sp. 1XD8-22]
GSILNVGVTTQFAQKNTRKHPILLYLNCLETSKDWSCVQMNFTIKIPGLEDVMITKVEEVEGRIALHIEMDVRVHKCPSCGGRTKKIHDYRVQKIKHLKWFERLTYLFYKKRRYACSCGKRFAEDNPIVHRYQRLSIEWNRAVAVRTVKAKTFKEV